MPLNVPQVLIDSNNPPLAGKEPLKRSKVYVKNMCSPPASLRAGSGTGRINSDVTVPCVRQNVGAFDISAKNNAVIHDLNKVNNFYGSQVDYYMLGDERVHRKELSDLKSDSCKPNGKGSNGDNVLFTFTSEESVTVKVYGACANRSCSCLRVIRGEQTQLTPCRFVYLYSLATPESKDSFSPLISSIVDGSQVTIVKTINLFLRIITSKH